MGENERSERTTLFKTLGPILIGVGGVLSGSVSSCYVNVYLPEHTPRTLNASSTLEKVGENKSLIALKGTFKIKNISKGRSDVLAGYYNVWGTRIITSPENPSGFRSGREWLISERSVSVSSIHAALCCGERRQPMSAIRIRQADRCSQIVGRTGTTLA